MSRFTSLSVGVLALQGDFARHCHQLRLVGARPVEVRLPGDLTQVHGLILPGGESTTMYKLIDQFDLRSALASCIGSRPVWGTCAGMILLARQIEDNQAGVTPLGAMDISVVRNGYGRQVFSFDDTVKARLNGHEVRLSASFIRAPRISRVGPAVEILAEWNGEPVLVSENNLLASSFHTELGDDTALLEYFLGRF